MSKNYQYSGISSRMKASKIRELMKYASMPDIISMAGGNPDPVNFPFDDVKEIINKWDKTKSSIAMQYGPTPGYPPLLELLKHRMIKNRKIDMKGQSLFITTGGQQAIFLTAKIFIDESDIIIVEEPSFIGAMAAFLSNGAKLAGVRLEDDGMDLAKLEDVLKKLSGEGKNPKFLYTIPNFQNPAGVTMSQNKRKKLYDISLKYQLVILEDDPYCDLYFTGSPDKYLPIKSLGNDAPIIYLNSFSKIMCPGFRLGWAVADEEVIDKAVLAKQSLDACSSSFGQVIAYDYLKNGFIDNYLEKMRKVYKGKKNLMKQKIKEYIPDSVKSTDPEGGFFIYLYLPDGLSAEKIFKKAIEDKVAVVTGDPFHTDPNIGDKHIRLSYSNSTDEQICKGIEVIGNAIKSFI
ncbi:MAG: PLP-dependent aminotransferase family protein [Spirochaetes bacterium]|nr:PLP-dependent aminotransferase family protein [Spirochaetota bacterium]